MFRKRGINVLTSCISVGGEWCVNSLLFLESRERIKTAAALVSCGPSDRIHFWAVYMRHSLYASFPLTSMCPLKIPEMDVFPTTVAVGVSATSKDPFAHLRRRTLVTTTDQRGDGTAESHLFVGDSIGRIHVWKIQGYALRGPEARPPPLLCVWRGHTEAISALEVVNSSQTLVTASTDCNVRLWKWDGSYIGTFGQPVRWNLNDPDTFQSPMQPFDVLIDPLTIPEVFQKNLQIDENSDDLEYSTRLKPSETTLETVDQEEQSRQSLKKTAEVAPSSSTISVFEVRHELESITTEGKRLRNLRTQPQRVQHGGPNDYQTLKIFEFTTSPAIHELKFSTPEQELEEQLAAKLDDPLPPLKPSIEQRIFAVK
uniref:WD repeat-containing protein on Y chromosome n=1 Tax=Schistocephalus solidus TaxID=70667 RepID=A0A0X3PS79_SCHSO